ncbi:hypothetical protein J3459_003810 [Metarhizium acridum]|nr:hypothetical protein J3459_003810 [Metarhizium acridum]
MVLRTKRRRRYSSRIPFISVWLAFARWVSRGAGNHEPNSGVGTQLHRAEYTVSTIITENHQQRGIVPQSPFVGKVPQSAMLRTQVPSASLDLDKGPLSVDSFLRQKSAKALNANSFVCFTRDSRRTLLRGYEDQLCRIRGTSHDDTERKNTPLVFVRGAEHPHEGAHRLQGASTGGGRGVVPRSTGTPPV